MSINTSHVETLSTYSELNDSIRFNNYFNYLSLIKASTTFWWMCFSVMCTLQCLVSLLRENLQENLQLLRHFVDTVCDDGATVTAPLTFGGLKLFNF